jgi:hypothetical protein
VGGVGGVSRYSPVQRESQREGQRAFNALVESEPHLAAQIRGTVYDPFYDDARLGRFHARVAELRTRS